jgi:hypothetical protein
MISNFQIDVAEPLHVGDDRPHFSLREEQKRDSFQAYYALVKLAVSGEAHSGYEWPLSEAGLRALANACLAAAEHLRVTNERLKGERR